MIVTFQSIIKRFDSDLKGKEGEIQKYKFVDALVEYIKDKEAKDVIEDQSFNTYIRYFNTFFSTDLEKTSNYELNALLGQFGCPVADLENENLDSQVAFNTAFHEATIEFRLAHDVKNMEELSLAKEFLSFLEVRNKELANSHSNFSDYYPIMKIIVSKWIMKLLDPKEAESFVVDFSDVSSNGK